MARPRAAAGPLSAYVLHQHDWSESSLIVELFTRERGRVVVVAKGAKRPYSQLRPVLLPLQRIAVQLGRPPADEAAELFLLRSAEWAGGAPMPSGAPLFAGFYLNELLLKLLARHDAHPALFDRYADAVLALQLDDDLHVQSVLRAFELLLLREIGVLPELGAVSQTLAPLRPHARYALHGEAGVVEVKGDDLAVPGAQLEAIETALASGSSAALREAVMPALAPLRAQLRGLLHYHLGTSSLRTREVMQGVRKLVDTETPPR